MSNPVTTLASSPTVTSTPNASTDRRGDDAQAPAPLKAAAETETVSKPKTLDEPLRLVIEPSASAGGYTYKLYDKVTGLLMIELPRESADKMSASPDYSAGQVYSAKA